MSNDFRLQKHDSRAANQMSQMSNVYILFMLIDPFTLAIKIKVMMQAIVTSSDIIELPHDRNNETETSAVPISVVWDERYLIGDLNKVLKTLCST